MNKEEEFSEPSQEYEQITVEKVSVEKDYKRCKTANTRVYKTCTSAPFRSKNNEKEEERFAQIHRKELQTRERQRQIARNEEEKAIKRLIDKENRWIKRAQTGKIRPNKKADQS